MPAHSHDRAAVAPTDVLDPVCGMTISPDDAVGHIDYKGETYYFAARAVSINSKRILSAS
jgi:Cu+-exporting ATPase